MNERKIGNHRITRKRDGWLQRKKIISIFLSRFSSSNSSESTDQDEVLKPLYYIVGDSSSEEMEATVHSVDDQSKERNEEDKSSHQTRLLGCMDFRFSRFLKVDLNNSRKSREGETVSEKRYGKDGSTPFQTRNSTSMNEIYDVEKHSNHSLKRMVVAMLNSLSISERMKSSGYRRKLRRIFKFSFVRRSTKHHTKGDSPSDSVKHANDDHISQLETKEENSESDDESLIQTTVLGVTFAHPVYTGRCNLLVHNVNPDIGNDLWKNMETNFSVEGEYYDLPFITKTVIETAAAESWGSISSSSLYPTDEQSVEDDFFLCNRFDSDVDIPFDETFTENIY